MKRRIFTLAACFLFACISLAQAQHSVAKQWNEALLAAIRKDLGRPTVQARNLFHVSLAMYDAWAAFDSEAETFFLGKTVDGYFCPFNGIAAPADLKAARNEAVSYAAYRLIYNRFSNSPGASITLPNLTNLMISLGYDPTFVSLNYSTGSPAALGNYIAQQCLLFGQQDGSNEPTFANQYYQPVNPGLIMATSGNPNMVDPNRWQPLTLAVFIDQNGNVIPINTPPFLSPEWGNVTPYSLKEEDKTVYFRDGHQYNVYHDPGPFPALDTANGGAMSDEFIWNFSLVSAWSSHLDPADGVQWDISPASIGNIQNYPQTLADLHTFYDFENGGTPSPGWDLNPKTGLPYEPQIVPRGDYARVLAEFWADGPNSETPPGHWFTILNYVTDQPLFEYRWHGQGPLLDTLEFDVKAYMTLGGTMHDVAVSVWGAKGWYDGVRPVSAIRYMAEKGQSSDPGLPNYHPAGFKLIPGFIEQVQMGDPLAGANNLNVGEIKIKAWKGPNFIIDPASDVAGVDWILAKNWWPYQRPTFVTPPFGGYISGHSTYSSAAAATMTALTGDPYFPGGMGVFPAPQNQYLVFEDGPSVNLTLQWATYKDASDQCSLSRIWGGIHPPMDDIPGRYIGDDISQEAFAFSEELFYNDADNDGFYSYNDCNDFDASVNPLAAELCDGLDNNCNGLADDGLTMNTYFADGDNDGFGIGSVSTNSCEATAPAGYSDNSADCDDTNASVNPAAAEICDDADNNCNAQTDEGLPVNTYFEDGDGDGFGYATAALNTCLASPPAGYVASGEDCNDGDAAINPNASEICDGIDQNCNTLTDEGLPLNDYYPDNDGDSFGNPNITNSTCEATPPAGFVANDEDCDDGDPAVNPAAPEVCDDLDNNCNIDVDEGLPTTTYYFDGDGDGYGDTLSFLVSCETAAPSDYVATGGDCDDSEATVFPGNPEIFDGLDNNCDGNINEGLATGEATEKPWKIFPNPSSDVLNIAYQFSGELTVQIFRADGRLLRSAELSFANDAAVLTLNEEVQGVYLLIATDEQGKRHFVERIVKI